MSAKPMDEQSEGQQQSEGLPPAAQSAGAPAKAQRRGPGGRTLLVSALALAAAAGGALWIMARPSVEATDDAYVAADSTTVAPKVRGLVGAVFVRDNQVVHVGDPLVRIDSEEFDAKAASGRADLADAEADVAAARAALVSLDAEERLAAAQVTAARTTIRSTAAEAERAETDRQRYDALVATGAVARRDAETYRATAINGAQAAARAKALLAVSRQQASVTAARRPTLLAALEKAQATRQRAIAALDLARQDQAHTIIRAAVDGVVGNRQVHVGDYVQPGSRLLTLVPMNALYVTANFKETQTRDMRAGQRATISVDALDHALSGRVESFAPGTGSSFSLLPFEPGTGNFTKIVQRVPVRIRFDPGQAANPVLRPGLSVTAKVRLSN
ncbi:HlyD family secretion protein [Novosphingobium sp. SG720]|uniref:HlyD family secretion protein n=1 Tax=Novosphingobium sp. SG720 TaxID=2586998 RepID=UPI001834339A|nr:membrane fusion protein (multidrug efflux system) [Novosphingobium sp. SG720]